ncbi:MAG: phage baseplate assembly protein V [Bacteroidales bacterium]|nr:phage baseplate assembly protein V [Bacteroidales bacterium]
MNPVRPKVRLDGEEIPFESLTLEQSVNSCHRFDVVQEFMSQDEMWKTTPQKLVSNVGARVLIHFEHQSTGETYEFSGYVTDVRIDAWESEPDYEYYNHRSNRVHFIGEGDVMRLNGALGMDSFVDSTLKDIVSEVVSPTGISLECQPRFDGVVPYVMRYKESVFGFLNRLSSTYNELFFYDGKKLWFGKPGNCGEETLVYEQDIFSLRTHASILPHKVSAYEYFVLNDTTDSVNASKASLNGMLGDVAKASERLYEEEELVASGSPLTDKGYLMSYADNKQRTIEGGMLNIEGETRTCRIKLGCVVEVSFPSEMKVDSMGRYRIVSIVHRVNKAGNYSNHFMATPEGHEYVTQQFLDRVKAYPEVATVSDNSDPKNIGRVQVQFDWQKRLSKNTNWIRVQSPDAGGSNMKNRGLVFVPEVGDQVMIGFEYGDPSRPYVMGSMFTGTNGLGGDDGNIVHSITTKSGHKLTFIDKGDWSISIQDHHNNLIKLDTAEKSIIISAPQKISLFADQIDISAGKGLTVSSGENTQISVGSDSTFSVGGTHKTDITKEMNIKVEGETKIDLAKKTTIQVDDDLNEKISGAYKVSGNDKIDIGAQSDLSLKSGSGVNIG